MKNDVQSYGGGSLVLNTFANKPCFLPIYNHTGERAIAYIGIEQKQRIILRLYQSVESSFISRFIVYYR